MSKSRIKGRLQNSEGNCCLGVFCRTMGFEFIPHGCLEDFSVFKTPVGDWENLVIEFGSDYYFSNPVVGMDLELGDYLAEQNDSGVSFEKIASYPEKHKTLIAKGEEIPQMV